LIKKKLENLKNYFSIANTEIKKLFIDYQDAEKYSPIELPVDIYLKHCNENLDKLIEIFNKAKTENLRFKLTTEESIGLIETEDGQAFQNIDIYIDTIEIRDSQDQELLNKEDCVQCCDLLFNIMNCIMQDELKELKNNISFLFKDKENTEDFFNPSKTIDCARSYLFESLYLKDRIDIFKMIDSFKEFNKSSSYDKSAFENDAYKNVVSLKDLVSNICQISPDKLNLDNIEMCFKEKNEANEISK
jgi:hypothetical protein